MSSGLDKYKVDFNGLLPSVKRIRILQTYIEKVKEINKSWDEEDGIDTSAPDYEPDADVILDRINAFAEYRTLRTKEAYESKMNNLNNLQSSRYTLIESDRKRRISHTTALSALIGLVDFGKKNNLEPLYEGKLFKDEIDFHDGNTIEEMTAGFLRILKDIDSCSIEHTSKEIISIKKDLNKVSKEYGVTKNLEHYDDDIEFKDFKDQSRGF